MIRPLIAAGIALLLAGAIVLGLVRSSRLADTEPEGAVVGEASATAPPSRAWSAVAGLAMAAGAGCIGIGMNRWRQTR